MSKNWAYLMLTGSALFWSGNFVLGRAIATEISPITLAYWRWMIALIILLPFSFRMLIKQWSVVRQHWRFLTFMAVISVSCFNTFVYLGLQTTTATNALLINSFIPILIILLSRIKPGIPISRFRFSGILISSVGVLVLVLRGNPENLIALSFNQGDFWVLAAAFTWAVYSISLRWRPTELSAQAFLLFNIFIGLLFLGPFYWLMYSMSLFYSPIRLTRRLYFMWPRLLLSAPFCYGTRE